MAIGALDLRSPDTGPAAWAGPVTFTSAAASATAAATVAAATTTTAAATTPATTTATTPATTTAAAAVREATGRAASAAAALAVKADTALTETTALASRPQPLAHGRVALAFELQPGYSLAAAVGTMPTHSVLLQPLFLFFPA